MKAVTSENRILVTGLNDNEELNLDLSKALNLNGGTVERLELFYQDKRVMQQQKTTWQTFISAFITSIGWSTGAALVSAISIAFFNVMKARSEKS